MLRGVYGAFALFYAILATGLPTTFTLAWQTRNTAAPACAINNTGHNCQCSLDKGMSGTCCCKHGGMGEGVADGEAPGSEAGHGVPAAPNEPCSKLASCGTPAPMLAGALLRIALAPAPVTHLLFDREAGVLESASQSMSPSRHPDPLEKIPI